MNKTNLAWIVAALVLGACGIYAVFSLDDSGAQAKTRQVVAAQDNSGSVSGPLAAHAATLSSGLSSKAQDAVTVNPFGK